MITFIYGFFSDWLGRKGTTVALLIVTALSYALFAYGVMNNWAEPILGLLIGAFLGAYWGAGDTIIMMVGESSPTNLRASIMTAQSAFYGIGMIASLLIGPRILGIAGKDNANLSTALWVFLIFASIAYLASALLLIIFTKETKGAEVEEINIDKKKGENE